MKKTILSIFFFFCSIIIFSDVIVHQCQEFEDFPGPQYSNKHPTNKVWQKVVKKIIEDAIPCLPQNLRDKLMDYLNKNDFHIQMVCDENFDACGQAWHPKWGKKFIAFAMRRVDLPDQILSECGCYEAITLHELIHLGTLIGEEGHPWIYPCAFQCTTLIKNCKKFPPPPTDPTPGVPKTNCGCKPPQKTIKIFCIY